MTAVRRDLAREGFPQILEPTWRRRRAAKFDGGMPKSRGRRHHSRRRSTPRRNLQRARSELRQALADLPILQDVDAAESRGDAQAALALIESDLEARSDNNFWRPERLQRLVQIVWLGPLLPGWATSRWILAQAAQCLDPRWRDRTRKALEIAIATRGGEDTLVGVDAVDAKAKVLDHDWVFRQLLLYELGGLQQFIARVATPDLLVGADRIHAWARTPMAAFRFVRESADILTWLDLRSGEEVQALNIGAASLLVPGECAIGRMVPIEGGAMFESAPLFVPDDVGRRVADNPTDWVAALSRGLRSPRATNGPITTAGHDFRLLTDVPTWVEHLVCMVAIEREGGDPWVETSADLAAVQVNLIRAALDQGLADMGLTDMDLTCSPWPSVAATLTSPHVVSSLEGILGPPDVPKLHRLAQLLGGPASEVCRALAREVGAAA